MSEKGENNRLIHEHSLYLLMHADNPVDWYPWGEEAFSKARREDIPVFLSIGYASCHWCHVMEKECFRDPVIAELINRSFVPVKVDREERPDLDQIYMQVCQLMTGTGGWPLSLFLTPEKDPFYAATYIPGYSRPGMVGMNDLLPYITRIWSERRSDINDAGKRVFAAFSDVSSLKTTSPASLCLSALRFLEKKYDPVNGGFSHKPKFPSVPQINFLLASYLDSGDENLLHMVEKTLRHVAAGGIRDHLDGGFHRYATDEAWRVPHFEKMLYDQALNSDAFLRMYICTRDPFYCQIARESLDYTLFSLRDESGGMYSSQDADSPDGEGAFYLWQKTGIESLFPGIIASQVARYYGVTGEGNVSMEPGMPKGANVLETSGWKDPLNDPFKMMPDGDSVKKILLEARSKRSPPLTDNKILTDWNGLMIRSLARAAIITGHDRYLLYAIDAADFLLREMALPGGRILHRWHLGNSGITGMAADYIFLAHGLLMLFQVTGRSFWLEKAISLESSASELMWDNEAGGYYGTDADSDLPVRMKDLLDSALPSVNGLACELLNDLFMITGDRRYFQKREMLLSLFSGIGQQYPGGILTALSTVYASKDGIRAVIVGFGQEEERECLQIIHLSRLPHVITIPVRSDEKESLNQWNVETPDDMGIFICKGTTCLPPVWKKDELVSLLNTLEVF